MNRLEKQTRYIDSLRSRTDFQLRYVYDIKIVTYEDEIEGYPNVSSSMLAVFKGHDERPILHRCNTLDERLDYINEYIEKAKTDFLIRSVCGPYYCENCD